MSLIGQRNVKVTYNSVFFITKKNQIRKFKIRSNLYNNTVEAATLEEKRKTDIFIILLSPQAACVLDTAVLLILVYWIQQYF